MALDQFLLLGHRYSCKRLSVSLHCVKFLRSPTMPTISTIPPQNIAKFENEALHSRLLVVSEANSWLRKIFRWCFLCPEKSSVSATLNSGVKVVDLAKDPNASGPLADTIDNAKVVGTFHVPITSNHRNYPLADGTTERACYFCQARLSKVHFSKRKT